MWLKVAFLNFSIIGRKNDSGSYLFLDTGQLE
jgi:hypothetical protein